MSTTNDLINEFKENDDKFSNYFDEYSSNFEAAYAVKSLRDSLGLSQKDFAHLIGKPQSTISRIETGSMNVSTKLLQEISVSTNKKLKISYI